MLSKIIPVLLFLTVVAGVACTPKPRPARPPKPPVETVMAEVEPLLSERRFGEAIGVLEDISRNYPDSPPPLLRLGQIYLTQRRWLLAEDAFNRALARDLDNPMAQAGLAEAWFNQGRLGDALNLWQALTRSQPDLPGVYVAELEINDDPALTEAFLQVLPGVGGDQARIMQAAELVEVDVIVLWLAATHRRDEHENNRCRRASLHRVSPHGCPPSVPPSTPPSAPAAGRSRR